MKARSKDEARRLMVLALQVAGNDDDSSSRVFSIRAEIVRKAYHAILFMTRVGAVQENEVDEVLVLVTCLGQVEDAERAGKPHTLH